MDIFEKYYRVYVAINLDNIQDNIRKLKSNIKENTKFVAVIKADGYGHGATMIVKHASKDVDAFAVATADEALSVKEYAEDKPIIILGFVNAARYAEMIENDIRMCVFKYEDAVAVSEVAGKLGKKAFIHIKVDTGMGRIGFDALNDEAVVSTAKTIEEINKLENINIEGIFTHFALADVEDKYFVDIQYGLFMKLIAELEKKDIYIPMKHCDNSAAIIDMPDTNLDAVRAGIAMYGLEPSSEIDIKKFDLKQAMELKSHIVYIKEMAPNTSIGYGRSYFTERKSRIATVPVGYGDGYLRNLSNKGFVLINGKTAPIVGRVCMDQFMVDVTDIPEAKEGDVVTLAGFDNGGFIDISELAALAGTFNYEFICDVGKRVPRVYYKDGKVVGTKDDF